MAQRYKLSKKDKERIQSLLKEYHKLFPIESLESLESSL